MSGAPMRTRLARLYGPRDLRLEVADVPAPGDGEVLLKMAAGGICGSDLHYYQDGGFGPVRVREPIIPGHEASGRVAALGASVSDLAIDDLVAVNPSQPCGTCRFCGEGLPVHCLDMRFLGSAMRLPHTQGMFRDWLVVPAVQCHPAGSQVSPGEAACAEPLAVCLHAVAQADEIRGKKVLVTGAGPIGTLVVAAARHAGADEIVVTDLADAALDRAKAMGATRIVNVRRDPAGLAAYEADKGKFHVAFECSAAEPALRGAVAAVRPRGTIVQVGVTGEITLPLHALVGKELRLVGSQRFDGEFALAVALISDRRIDVRPIISHQFPVDEAVRAFEQAGDRSTACKVQLTFLS
ncbi:alcohol dehydrogenase catalytic domain-containing protein [Sinorhizobium meliloti]|nr:L-idonate 5-dehydrogenase [Sinorhizobium meliloti]ASP95469.1 L-idonate 5-dehydrogenase [Sinorhizobium meliloti]MQX57700.1 alcohol dehydrogenase catalytic domain-containing protein [Sinorhizobium meliloti]RVM17433.1 L-idonate 5-dehydrogenase [Sinorhizobium meliloti]RVO37259.1 L-idonate 5-dehydrogenase [Sinorhizobium meliloti]